MDSCNSGSLQSSSGGDEEYDSRAAAAAADSFSAFLNTQQPHNVGSISNPPPPPQLYDPLLSNYLQLQQNPNIHWPRPNTLRSDPNHSHILSTFPQTFLPSFQPPLPVESDNNVNNNINLTDLPPPQNQNQAAAAARNPKKRSRASRRAPTTVLTTDTTNFRAMVQEFTGIPAPPFNNSSLFPRNRLDLFGNITRSTSFDASATPPPYLRRPLPQKIQSTPTPPPFLGSSLNSSTLDATSASSNINKNNTIITDSVSSTTSSANADFTNYQIPITQNQNPHVFNYPNPFISSLLHSNSKFPFSNSNSNSSFGNIPLNDNHLDEFGALGRDINRVSNPTLPNLISSDQIANANEGDRDGQARIIRCVNENSYKMNYSSAAAANSSSEKRQENNNTRGDQGTVESWICSSSD